jgi:hypothetical protein
VLSKVQYYRWFFTGIFRFVKFFLWWICWWLLYF